MEDVEEEGSQAVAAAGTGHEGVGSEVTHRVLESTRRAGVVDAQHLAVEHEVATRQGGDDVDDSARGDR